MNQDVNVAIISSEFYAPYAATTIVSILHHLDKERNICFYLLSNDITQGSIKKIERLKRIRQFEIKVIYIEEKDLAFCGDIKSPYYISRIAASRLLLPSILQSLDKVVCVESDMIFLDDISKLYDLDIGENWIGAVEDFARKVHARDLWRDERMMYYNTGVILLNLKKLREVDYLNILRDKIKQSGKLYRLQEQCLMNDAYKDHFYRLNIKWNFYHEFYPESLKARFQFQAVSKEEYLYAMNKPSVVHTPGADKFWHPHYVHPFKRVYMSFYRETGFYSWIRVPRYQIFKVKYFYVLFREHAVISMIESENERKLRIFGVPLYSKKFKIL